MTTATAVPTKPKTETEASGREAQKAALDRAKKLLWERLKRAKALDRAIDEFVAAAGVFVRGEEELRRRLL